jgi:SAM-dependent methyltransferase
MHAVPYEMWREYYLLLLTQREAVPNTLLDLCCGTGTLTEQFAELGYEMAGIDLSRTMIRKAQEKALEKGLEIEYIAADAGDFKFNRQFEAAYSFFDSLNYITDLGHLKKALQNVSDHLIPGATFIFDLNTSYAFEAKMFNQKDTRKKATVRYDWNGHYDQSSRIIKVEMDFWVGDEKFHEQHVQRAHTEEEMLELLSDSGFEEISIYDSYTLNRPRKQSDRVHYVMTKV